MSEDSFFCVVDADHPALSPAVEAGRNARSIRLVRNENSRATKVEPVLVAQVHPRLGMDVVSGVGVATEPVVSVASVVNRVLGHEVTQIQVANGGIRQQLDVRDGQAGLLLVK